MAGKPSDDIEQYKRVLTESGLINENQLHSVLDELEQEHGNRPGDSTILARRLIDRKMVTPWQNTHLMQGRHKGFFLGRYKLLGHLGSGGMSTVYLAEHMHMRRKVAIKVLAEVAAEDTAKVSRFFIESQAIAALDHPNIVRAHDFDTDGKFHYLVMEFVEGPDVQKFVDTNGPLSFEEAAEFIRQAAAGLHHAHLRGMIHRDIKPANLLMDPSGVVKILDMGVARITNREEVSLTLEQGIDMVGTVDYLSPEQALDSHHVDVRVDIYSLGCTLLFLLTGHAPFPTGTQAQRLLKHQMEMPNILNDRPDCPPDLLAIANKMMAKLPGERYRSAEEVVVALADWLGRRKASGGASQAPAQPMQPVRPAADTLEVSKQHTLMVRAGESGINLASNPLSDVGASGINLAGGQSGLGLSSNKIQFECEFCSMQIRAPGNSAGKVGKCPKCKAKLVIPHPDASIRIDGLKELLANFLTATRTGDKQWFSSLVKNLTIPKYELWAREVFGPELGLRVAVEYAQQLPRLDYSLSDFFAKMVARSKGEIYVRRIEQAAPEETTQVNNTLSAMDKPTVLYTGRFAAPGETKGGGILLASFFYVKFEFRFFGPMKCLENRSDMNG